jgi:hypothetical protein
VHFCVKRTVCLGLQTSVLGGILMLVQIVSGGLQELTGGIGLSGQDYFLEVALICL